MRIILFAHPSFLGHKSMPRFTKMLADGMSARGHEVEVYSPGDFFFNIPAPVSIKKWLGYIDQLFIFPAIVKKRIKNNSDTLYVFTDHALSMWVPIVKHLPHIIICHDFLAQRSAIGEIPQNTTSWTGRKYQQLIRNGYTQGRNFISVSKKTQQDLHSFLGYVPKISEVVYNGLNNNFGLIEPKIAREILAKKTNADIKNGYILHVGGNYWYKNKIGVVKIYDAWRSAFKNSVPLVLVGEQPDIEMQQEINKSSYKADIYFLDNITDELINAVYSGALTLIFPSYAEGFGWPIAEAMASGCIVVTTNEAPMTEVGGDAAIYIPAQPWADKTNKWETEAAKTLNRVITLPDEERFRILNIGFENSKRFNTKKALDALEKIFSNIFNIN
jgi:glycosyltransferase involved in cell wall biosynthesis